MKKLVVFVIAASLIFASAPAFAEKKQPGDGGAITKFFKGILGDSWKKGTPDKTVPATSMPTGKTKERIK